MSKKKKDDLDLGLDDDEDEEDDIEELSEEEKFNIYVKKKFAIIDQKQEILSNAMGKAFEVVHKYLKIHHQDIGVLKDNFKILLNKK